MYGKLLYVRFKVKMFKVDDSEQICTSNLSTPQLELFSWCQLIWLPLMWCIKDEGVVWSGVVSRPLFGAKRYADHLHSNTT